MPAGPWQSTTSCLADGLDVAGLPLGPRADLPAGHEHLERRGLGGGLAVPHAGKHPGHVLGVQLPVTMGVGLKLLENLGGVRDRLLFASTWIRPSWAEMLTPSASRICRTC